MGGLETVSIQTILRPCLHSDDIETGNYNLMAHSVSSVFDPSDEIPRTLKLSSCPLLSIVYLFKLAPIALHVSPAARNSAISVQLFFSLSFLQTYDDGPLTVNRVSTLMY